MLGEGAQRHLLTAKGIGVYKIWFGIVLQHCGSWKYGIQTTKAPQCLGSLQMNRVMEESCGTFQKGWEEAWSQGRASTETVARRRGAGGSPSGNSHLVLDASSPLEPWVSPTGTRKTGDHG